MRACVCQDLRINFHSWCQDQLTIRSRSVPGEAIQGEGGQQGSDRWLPRGRRRGQRRRRRDRQHRQDQEQVQVRGSTEEG